MSRKQNDYALFITLTTHGRKPLFDADSARHCLRSAMRRVQVRQPFTVEAVCLLSDHLHCLLRPHSDERPPDFFWREIKKQFSGLYRRHLKENKAEVKPAVAGQAIWQRGSVEVILKSDESVMRHKDYIHYDPVRHGLVKKPADYIYSSFHRSETSECRWEEASNEWTELAAQLEQP